jgi:UDP-glucuronate 4-epimerase
MNILITGGAGFIGSSLIDYYLKNTNFNILCIDNFDLFYNKEKKLNNLEPFVSNSRFKFFEYDILNLDTLDIKDNIDCIVHIAAKAGVRPSIENAASYFDVNVNGTLKVLEFAKKRSVSKVVFASSSSVYGVNKNIPWKVDELDLQPISPYASSKIAAEKIGFTYSYLFGIQFIALRFFTVYGPKQRPDLAISKFIKKIDNNEPIQIYGDGSTSRDYTYIDDIVEGIYKATTHIFDKHFEVFNLGNSNTIKLLDLVNIIGECLNKKPILEFYPEQEGDVPHTFSDIQKSIEILGYHPKTNIRDGIKKQVACFKSSLA